MRVKTLILAVVAAAVAPLAVRAGDFDKYLPADSEMYVHISVPKLFTSQMIRKAVPMAFDKYGEMIVPLVGMARQFDPNIPEVPEDQVKQALKQMADPKVIGAAFDAAKDAVTDIVICGNPNPGSPNVVVLIKSSFITPEIVEAIPGMLALVPQAAAQLKVEKLQKTGGSVLAFTMTQANQKFFVTAPEKGLVHLAMSEAAAEASLAKAGKPGEKLAGLMAKKAASDFIFAAVGKGPDFETMTLNLTLDADMTAKVSTTYADATRAAEEATKMNEKLGEMLGQLQGMLGDKAATLKPHLEKTKATADGKTVNGTISIPGSTVETLLKKD